MTRDELARAIEEARSSRVYANYLAVRDGVLDMLDRRPEKEGGPSRYWREELAGFDYLFDASPLVIAKLREHCYHLTGLRSYDYRGHHEHKARPFAEKLASLRDVDGSGLLVPESPLLGGFGHHIDGALINVDTLKFYECLIALDRGGALATLRERGGHGKVVIEIGAGWGGFAYQLRTLCPRVRYIIVDLPQSLLFSGTYLKTVFPRASMRLATEPVAAPGTAETNDDFILIPHFFLADSELPRPDLAVNVASFQEMTTEQVQRHAASLRGLGCPLLYSLNRERSPYNPELTSVSAAISESYSVQEVPVLDAPYTTLGRVPAARRAGGGPRAPESEYRHLLGRRIPG
jgi:hypothetical protein